MENNKLKIETEFGNIVCEKYEDDVQERFSVYLESKDGVILQDLVSIAQKVNWKKETLEEAMDVIIWTDENEDYTHRFEIKPNKMQENNNE